MKNILLLFSFSFLLLACKKQVINTNSANNQNNTLNDTTYFNLNYGLNSAQNLDLYLPKNRTNSTPLLIVIHGGAWKAGTKEDMNYYVNLIRSKWSNIAIANINYRLASNTNNIHHNEIINDIDSAYNYLLKNQLKYVYSSSTAIMGASAGAQLAMIYAYRYNSKIKCVASLFGPSIINDWSWYNSTNLWLGGKTGDVLTEYVGQTWDSTAYSNVSPYSNIKQNSAPTILFHGNLDPIVPVYQSQWMHNKLNSLNILNEYYEYIAFHSFDATQSDDVMNKLVNFMQKHI